MRVGIGLPAAIPGTSGDLILEWARRADAGPFSSLGLIDRLVYPNYEPLLTLAVAAGATTRIGLITTILIAPLRNAGVLGKQAASLDRLSGGRFTLGLGVGGREDDFRVAPAPFHDRGRRFDRQLEEMRRIWAGEAAEGAGPVGPPPAQPGGPELLIGANTPAGVARVGRWADGFMSGGAPPDQAQQLYALAEQSWQTQSRPGKPRFVAGMYFGLGQNAAERAGTYIRDYYDFLGPLADQLAGMIPSTPEAVKGAIQAFADVGVDELIPWPCIPDLDQVDRLADLIA